MDEREKLRQECHDDLATLRAGDMPERAFRLLEKLVARLDRLETGSFPQTETPYVRREQQPDPWRRR